jgi:hypothetical protein
MPQMTSFRGDTRDKVTLASHGGFVPLYLVESHLKEAQGPPTASTIPATKLTVTISKHRAPPPPPLLKPIGKANNNQPSLPPDAGSDGFIKCTNKTSMQLGCNCPGFDPAAMLSRARAFFKKALTDPSIVMNHVMFHNVGLLAMALPGAHVYGGNQYKFEGDLLETSLNDACSKYTGKPAPNNIYARGTNVYLDNDDLNSATLIAMVPYNNAGAPAELTFFSCVPMKYLTHVGTY